MEQSYSTVCPRCGGLGLTLINRGDRQFAAECDCRTVRREGARRQRARIPERYTHCSFENFETGFRGADPSLGMALIHARQFAEKYPVETKGRGLLLIGDCGTGKTHLAVAVLRDLIGRRGANGLFCDYRDLLKQIQSSYNPQVATTEMSILQPLFAADVLLLDDLGAVQPTGWVWDTVSHVLNTRYNDQKTTLITTNYVNAPATLARVSGPASDLDVHKRGEQTLGDRIGERMHSRLQEMCITITMQGEDLRRTVKRASFL